MLQIPLMLYDNIINLNLSFNIPSMDMYMVYEQSVKNSSGKHDHAACINQAIKFAEDFCEKKQLRLTKLRKHVLSLVWQTHKPIGAYAIMDMLEATSTREQVAPPTVYRALDFLVEHGLVHKVHSLNAFIGCSNPQRSQCDALFICTECGYTEEVPNNTIQQAINLSANKQKFSVEEQVLEITGRCISCKQHTVNKGIIT